MTTRVFFRSVPAFVTGAWLCLTLCSGESESLGRIGAGRRILFLDDTAVETKSAVERRFHAPRSIAPGPVLKGAFRGFVHREPGGSYRLYYSSGPVHSGTDKFFAIRMARSKNGLDWDLPDLGLIDVDPEFEEERDNVLIKDALLVGLSSEGGDKGGARWRAVVVDLGRSAPGAGSAEDPVRASTGVETLFTSNDGVHWTHAADSQGPSQTITSACGGLIAWLPTPPRYVRFDWVPGAGAGRLGLVRRESYDLVRWRAEAASIAGPAGAAPRLTPFFYHGNWLALAEDTDSAGHAHNQLAVSRDGREWSVVVRDFTPSFASAGTHPCGTGVTFDTAGGPVPVRDELWFYRVRPLVASPASADDYGTEAFALRRDGFASLDAGPAPGRVVTRPLMLGPGSTLHINAEIDPGGNLTASLLAADGPELAGFEESRSVALTAGGLDLPLHWSGTNDLAALGQRPVRVALRFTRARLYSCWID